MQDHTKLAVWEKAYDVMQRIHDRREDLRSRELFGAVSQLRHTTAALPTYIAQGCCREGNESKALSFELGFGAVCEAEYQLLIVRGRGYIPMDEYQYLSTELIAIKEMLAVLVGELRSTSVPKQTPTAEGAV